MKTRIIKVITALSLLAALVMVSPVQAQDLTTMLSKFLVDLRSGSLGVNQPITNITATGNVVAANFLSTNTFSSSGKSFLRTSTNGMWTMAQNSGASPILEVNMGTAVPTVTSCGTGAVTAKSTNTAGEVTPTGASACTVTFGAPAFSNAPFCVVTMETVAEAFKVSGASTTAFTVTFTTAANVFLYHCFGGA